MALDLSNFLVDESAKILEAMLVIDGNCSGTVFLRNTDNQVVASLTDGDVRRHILAAGSLDETVDKIANYHLTYHVEGQTYGQRKQQYKAIPVLDQDHVLISVLIDSKRIVSCQKLDLPVIIMAGGKGTRLYPYTQVLPKPLIPIGDLTITEHIISHFLDYGCRDITLIVNYKKEMIKAYFADVDTGCNISFVEEEKELGTGGGLALLKGRMTRTFFMTNCDILIDSDYSNIYTYHKKKGNLVTMVCAAKTVVVPYGTVEISPEGEVASLREKPEFSFLTNTGLYILEPDFLEQIPCDTFVHITDVIQSCVNKGLRVGVYPISEAQWSDMGQLGELEKMREKLGLQR